MSLHSPSLGHTSSSQPSPSLSSPSLGTGANRASTPTLTRSPSTPTLRTPSSSAVTIPIPGRSILKKPPPVQGGWFSRLSLGRFLGDNSSASASSASNSTFTSTSEFGGGA
ncbi:hypothetical protein C8R46DRAFT_1226279 [Mycena filopes]|nr:hypothetical protein C8R46DRAFT_1226279 [Mycena filopes]